MEDGRLTDSAGRVVSFKNAMIVLTSNVGSRVIASAKAGTGLSAFRAQREGEEEGELEGRAAAVEKVGGRGGWGVG